MNNGKITFHRSDRATGASFLQQSVDGAHSVARVGVRRGSGVAQAALLFVAAHGAGPFRPYVHVGFPGRRGNRER